METNNIHYLLQTLVCNVTRCYIMQWFIQAPRSLYFSIHYKLMVVCIVSLGLGVLLTIYAVKWGTNKDIQTPY